MTTYRPPANLPAWHSTFSAAANVSAATVHARGALDLFTVDLLQGAIDVLTAAGCTDITLDLAEVSSLDRTAAWCIAQAGSALISRRGQLTMSNARDVVQVMLGDLNSVSPRDGGSGADQAVNLPSKQDIRNSTSEENPR